MLLRVRFTGPSGTTWAVSAPAWVYGTALELLGYWWDAPRIVSPAELVAFVANLPHPWDIVEGAVLGFDSMN